MFVKSNKNASYFYNFSKQRNQQGTTKAGTAKTPITKQEKKRTQTFPISVFKFVYNFSLWHCLLAMNVDDEDDDM